MIFVQFLPVVLSFLMLAAHFLRAELPILSVVVLGFLLLLAVPRPWAARAGQIVLVLGAVEWVRTVVKLVGVRTDLGLPYGRMVVIQHPGGWRSSYSHLAQYTVSRGQHVVTGQTIGQMGNSGRSTGPHLHFELTRWGSYYDPLDLLGGPVPVD